jgi:hypothetical protein
MQFRPGQAYSHAGELSRCRPAPADAALAGNRVPLEPLTVTSLQAVPADVDGLLPPVLVMHSALESMTS